MWLFDRRQLAAGATLAKERTVIANVVARSGVELEVESEIAGGHRPLLLLRLPEGGELKLVTQCTCVSGVFCQHAAAALMYLDSPEGQSAVEQHFAARRASADDAAESNPEAAPAVLSHELPNDHPKGCLRLRRLPPPKKGAGPLAVAEPLVAYEGSPSLFSPMVRTGSQMCWVREGRGISLRRNYGMERLLLADLLQTGLINFEDAYPGLTTDIDVRQVLTVPESRQPLFWAEFLRDAVPRLRAEGWTVEIPVDFGFEVLDAATEPWFTDVAAESDDAFRLDLGLTLSTGRMSLVPLLVECIDQGLTAEMLESNIDQNFLIAIPGARQQVLSIPARRLLVLLRFLDDLLAARPVKKDGRLKLDKLRAAQLESLDGLPIQVPEQLRQLRERLQGFRALAPIATPAGLRAKLRPYQLEGLAWLQFLRESGLHGVLADDMGLGKTLQTLAHLLLEKESDRMDRPSLILAPTSVIRNWGREAARFAPALRVLLLHGDDRRSDFFRIPRHDLVITSYPLLVRDAEHLSRQPWHLVVLDEAQNIKNAKSQTAQAATTLNARHRLCLTGTPMENHLGELWSLFHFLMPGLLGDAESFRVRYRNPIEKEGDIERQAELAGRLKPVLLRRTKSAVAKDLPPKTEILHRIELDKAQSELYEAIRAAADKRVREAIEAQGLDRSQIVVLDALLKLRQVCCHPNLVKAETARSVTDSAKTSFLMKELLPQLIEEGRRVLIFSQFTEMLALIEGGLKRKAISYVKLTGDTRDRETPMRRFQQGEIPVFLISLKAGGAGLNLTAADAVIHYDPWWNPAAEAQASDRAHRIGQTKPVFIHKLICQDTIEERILEMQRSKAALVEGLLTGSADKLKLSQEDVQRLLEA